MKQVYTVGSNEQTYFLNLLAPRVFEWIASKAKAKKAMAEGELLVNGQKVNWDAKVNQGDIISYAPSKQAKSKASRKVYELKMDVVFEDDHLAIVNKPGGIPVNGNQFKTLENALPYNLKPSREPDSLDMPRPLHRLDGPTCGLVMIAKTDRAQVAMGKQFQFKEITKRYKAVVIGKLPTPKGTIETPIEGKSSTTDYEVVRELASKKYGHLSLVALFPVTGRTHQLRIHMSGLGHPIVGDKYYSKEHDILQGKGLLLCSDMLSFTHPISQKHIEVEIDIPNKFMALLQREQQRSKLASNEVKRRR